MRLDPLHERARRVLLLAYMFPPIIDGGAIRPAAFARYLPEFGYSVSVLTRPLSNQLPVDVGQLDKLGSQVRVDRVSIDFREGWQDHFRRKFSWLGPLEALLGRPRGWIADGLAWRVALHDQQRPWEVTWMSPAVDAGALLIERERPDFILATAPPFETLKAGCMLSERTGIPLVADFRDPWTYGVLWNPPRPARSRREHAWERRVVDRSAKVLVVTPTMQRNMVAAYPRHSGKVELIMNGYDEAPQPIPSVLPIDRFVVRFVGSIMERRFPPVFFDALKRLRSHHADTAKDLHVEFVGPNQTAFSLSDRIRDEGVADMVEYVGPVGHDRARNLMRSAHVLLHIETTATYAVSSKLFEYFAAGRPILGIVPAGSDDEWFLERSGTGFNVGIDDAERIASSIHSRWCDWRNVHPVAPIDEAWLGQFHRREQTRMLACLLDDLLERGVAAP